MGTSLYDQFLKEQGGGSPSSGSLYDQFLKGASPQGPAGMDIHEEYRRGLLGKRMARENQNDREAAALETTPLPGAIGKAGISTLLNIGQALPGMEAVQAGIGSAVSRLPTWMGGSEQPLSYNESLETVRGLAGAHPAKVLARGLSGAALAPLLPASPVASGALLGYAEGALSPDMDQSLLERTGRGAVGAGIGALLGKGLEKTGTVVRALRTKTPQANILQRQAERAESAARLYGAAQSEGERNGANTAVRSFIQEPEIADRIAALKTLEQYQHLADDSPEMMRALARSMSDEAKMLQKGMAQVDPSKPNTLRDKAKSLGLTKARLKRVVSEPSVTTKPPLYYDVPGTSVVREPKPPLTLDVAPEVLETEAVFSRGTPYRQGHVMEGTAGAARGNQAQVAIDASGRAIAVSPRDVQGPAGPAFQLREQPEQLLRPGVRIETPGMRVQTAPGQPGFELTSSPMRVQTAPAETVTEPAMMPSFREAEADFARRTRDIEAIGKGMNALQGATKNKRPTFDQIQSKKTKTPETFAAWYQTASPSEKQAAIEGILGDVKNAFGEPGWRLQSGRRATGKAAEILRSVDPSSTEDILRLLGIATAASTP